MQTGCRGLVRPRLFRQCLRQDESTTSPRFIFPSSRSFRACASRRDDGPLRKQLKDATKEARKQKASPLLSEASESNHDDVDSEWELTVGIEIHAQLNASRKLFSSAVTATDIEPNSELAPLDISLPGSLPVFQPAVLLPALRAATVLGCTIQKASSFDRKHYFYHDQPAGYQITQYYQPYATDGYIQLSEGDGLEPGRTITVNIKQVQLEQDTARTQEANDETTLIDFNRSGHALVEIISLPELHSAKDAAAYVKKVQSLLHSVDAVTTGMEQGGLRADVNVSVRKRGQSGGPFSYSGVTGLGQRTEIKNLGTLKGIEDAINAESKRQIGILEAGGVIEGETRGWSLTNPHETKRLRGKEGEVDYRYMPDADIPPLHLHADLIDWVKETLPPTAEELRRTLVKNQLLTPVDAAALVDLNDGERLLFFRDVITIFMAHPTRPSDQRKIGRLAANWVLHELGALLSTEERVWATNPVPPLAIVQIIRQLIRERITGNSAKLVLKMIFNGDDRSVREIIEQEKLWFSEIPIEIYEAIAKEIIDKHPQEVRDIAKRCRRGKLQYLVGQMMRHEKSRNMRPMTVEKILLSMIQSGK
jgi:aspartyl-tRNA(Asn)/glutamyl-tRNA(Gln) amidotransferase subunit B